MFAIAANTQEAAFATLTPRDKAMQEAEAAIGTNAACALIIFKLDSFKRIADLGADTAEYCLKRAARAICSAFTSEDIVCRWESGEFVALMRSVSENRNIYERANAVNAAIKAEFSQDAHLDFITVSAGAATSDYGGNTFDLLYARALDAFAAAEDKRGSYLGVFSQYQQIKPDLYSLAAKEEPKQNKTRIKRVSESRAGHFTLLIAGVTIIFFVVLLGMSIYITYRTTRETYMASMQHRASDAMARIEATLSDYGDHTLYIASIGNVQALLSDVGNDSTYRMLRLDVLDKVRSSVGQHDGYEGFILQDSEGNVVISSSDSSYISATAISHINVENVVPNKASYCVAELGPEKSRLIAITAAVQNSSDQTKGYVTLFFNSTIYDVAMTSSLDERMLFDLDGMDLIEQNGSVSDDLSEEDFNLLVTDAKKALASGVTSYDYTGTDGRPLLASVAVSDTYNIMLLSFTPASNMTRAVGQYVMAQAGMSLLILIVLTIIINSIYRLNTEPLSDMINRCSRLANGYETEPFEIKGDSEMRKLAAAFNLYRERLENAAYTDTLLYIGTRAKFLAYGERHIKNNTGKPFVCCLVDLVNFRQYNDMFSIEIGDALLVAAAEHLKTIFGDRLYRIDGDVFMGVLEGEWDCEYLAEKVRAQLRRPVQIGQLEIMLDCRIALCTYPQSGSTVVELLENANAALAHAKEQNLNSIIYSAELTKELRYSDEILKLLHKSIIEHTLEVWYQPIYNVETGLFTSSEALMRLHDEDGNILPTGKVVEIAERNGMIDAVGEYVLDEAVRTVQRLREAGRTIDYVHVNVSAQQMVQSNCAKRLLDIIENAGGVPSDVSMELTETSIMSSFEAAAVSVKQFRAAGAHVSLDDFGSGYSGLGYLSSLDLDILKLDANLVRNVAKSDEQREYLKLIVELARLKKLHTVAEGVEDQNTLDAVKDCGADYIQGYYFSKPLCEADYAEFMEKAENK